MKIFITAESNDLNSLYDERFGRAKAFMVVELDTMQIEKYMENENLNAGHGVGVLTAQIAIESGADIIIANRIGPKAMSVIKGTGKKIYQAEGNTIKEVIENYKNSKLKEITS